MPRSSTGGNVMNPARAGTRDGWPYRWLAMAGVGGNRICAWFQPLAAAWLLRFVHRRLRRRATRGRPRPTWPPCWRSPLHADVALRDEPARPRLGTTRSSPVSPAHVAQGGDAFSLADGRRGGAGAPACLCGDHGGGLDRTGDRQALGRSRRRRAPTSRALRRRPAATATPATHGISDDEAFGMV